MNAGRAPDIATQQAFPSKRAAIENASGAFRRSKEAWRAYRDTECAWRGASGSDLHRTCLVELSHRRALDLR